VNSDLVIPPPSPKKESTTPPSDSYVSSGRIVFQEPEKKMPAKSDGYVSQGVILFSSPEPPKQPKIKPELLLKQARLQQAIARVCGKSIKDVEVKVQSEKELTVSVKARTAKEGQTLSAIIFQMPELGPYKVALDIPLAQ
jgi:hypothetical protein